MPDGVAFVVHQLSPPEPVTIELFTPERQDPVRLDHSITKLLDRVSFAESFARLFTIFLVHLLRPSAQMPFMSARGKAPRFHGTPCELWAKVGDGMRG